MPETIAIEVAQDVAEATGCRQVILLAWDGERSHVVTFGVSEDDSDHAAEGGNRLKLAMGWPEHLCRDESRKVTALRSRIAELEHQLAIVGHRISIERRAGG